MENEKQAVKSKKKYYRNYKKNKHRRYSVNQIRDLDSKMNFVQSAMDFSKDNNIISLLDLTKTQSRTFTIFSKDKLRQYMKNPKLNENNLQELSKFLYRLSFPYRRIIQYFAQMMDFSAYIPVPVLKNLIGDKDKPDTINKSVFETVKYVRKINLPLNIMPFLITAWMCDTAYGYKYEDDNGMYIMPLDNAYCQVSSVNKEDGTFNFAFDFSFFRSNEYLLDYWDKEFKQKYDAYLKDTSLRWQELDDTRTFCIKINVEDRTMSLPPFLPLFEQIIDLVDLQSIQAVKEQLSIYKLLVLEVETLNSAQEANQWKVNLETAKEYYYKLMENLPEEVSAAISPVPIKPIEFKGNSTSDIDMIANSMSNLFKASGTSQILDSTEISGSVAFTAAILSDTLTAVRIILPQISAWVNKQLQQAMSNPATIKFFEVSAYTKNELISSYMTASQYGVPVKLGYAALLGYDAIEVASLNYLEQSCLNLSETWKPLQSSHTQSGLGSDVDPTKGGRPEKADSELTAEGDETRMKDKNKSQARGKRKGIKQ